MATVTCTDQPTELGLAYALFAPIAEGRQEWTIRSLQRTDVASVKKLFKKLHTFNASLDARFALSAEWESHFDAAIQQALRGENVLALIAYDADTDRPCGFVLATIHSDSGMWYYHEWVEVEGLYVEDRWRGHGLAELLLGQTCEWANSIHQSVVQLYVTASNERAINFYQHKGFRETQVVMRKVLSEA